MITLEGVKNVISQGLITFWSLDACLCSMTKALKQAKVDQGIGEGVEVGDCVAIPKVRAFDSKLDSLAIDPFGGRALAINFFVEGALAVEGVTQASANAGRHGNRTTALASTFMVNGTRPFDEFVLDVLGEERADILAAFVFDEGQRAIEVSEKERHGESSLANR